MGQYYAPVIINQRSNPEVQQWFYSHIYGQGLKLMEHSYVNNSFVRAVETYLLAHPEGLRIVWAGDYADAEPEGESNLYERTYGPNGDDHNWSTSVVYQQGLQPLYPGFEMDDKVAGSQFVIDTPLANSDDVRFLINHDRKIYIDTANAPLAYPDEPEWGEYRLNPLPLLSAEGCGRGGGDYADVPGVGSWARDLLTVASEPLPHYAPIDFAELLLI
ncbi:Uncharacterised protein [Mycobacteroides abscessus subsp. massiliense]|nr:Uncharacterised protein [Mycobacteroides abscessus subsp. massiliense]